MLTVGSSPNRFAIVEFRPEEDGFTAQCLIDQILKPSSQEHSTKYADIARRSLWLHLDNSPCHTARIAPEEVTCLKCKTVLHPPDSRDLTIADFYLFAFLKQKLQSIDVSDDEELKNEILAILQGFPSDELKKSFDHWIERCQ
jgi:hypothetical protein